jgi:hypothetical protein
MQASVQQKPSTARLWILLVVALILAVVMWFVASSRGGDTGRTWMNLPSVPVEVAPNGVASVFGFNVAALPPNLIQQFQSANWQQVDLRWGNNGLNLYANGEQLPSLAWDGESIATLQEVLPQIPGVPYAQRIANALPWLRKVGGGASLQLPVAEGQSRVDVPRWSGETTLEPEQVAEPTIGPLAINNITFDESGAAYIGNIPASALGAAFTLPENVRSILNSLGVEKAGVVTTPGGMEIALDDRPLPKIAYNAAALERVAPLLGGFLDESTMTTVSGILPDLPGADLQLTATFNGQPAGEANLSNLDVAINPDGTVRALGVNLGSQPLIPADTLAMLQNANVQRLDVAVDAGTLNIAANGQPLPQIAWSSEGQQLIGSLVGSTGALSQEQFDSIIQLADETNFGLGVTVPPAAGATPIEAQAPAGPPTFAPVDLGDFAPPILRADVVADADGTIQSIGNIDMATLANLGVSGISLPSNVLDILAQAGAQELRIVTGPNQADIQIDGESAVTLNYDAAALQSMLDLAKPFLAGTPLEDPNVMGLIEGQILPLVPGSDVNVSIALQ